MKSLQDKTMLEQRLLRAQMNPHFLFNTLSTIQGYMLENDTARANQYLSRFSRLMRNILDNTSRESVLLEQEISTIGNYLELQKIRYQGRFDYQITVDENIDPESTFIPPMLAQPFIENAIEHGIKHSPDKGEITVAFSTFPYSKSSNRPIAQSSNRQTAQSSNRPIILEVTDNGVGRAESARIESPRSKDHRPMATAITRERLRVLSRRAPRRLRQHIGLEIEDLADSQGNPSGTRVRLVVPVG
jgi:signal transduction histidine kinase